MFAYAMLINLAVSLLNSYVLYNYTDQLGLKKISNPKVHVHEVQHFLGEWTRTETYTANEFQLMSAKDQWGMAGFFFSSWTYFFIALIAHSI